MLGFALHYCQRLRLDVEFQTVNILHTTITFQILYGFGIDF